MKKRLWLMLTLWLLIISLPIKTFAQKDGDWQFWNTDSVEKDINEALKLVLEEEFRWGNDMNRFIYHHSDIGLVYKITDWFNLGQNFRYVINDNAGQWEHEARPHLNATFKWTLFNLDFSNRNRFEYRHLTRTKDTWRYRNMSKLKIPLNWTRFKISPSLSEEAFFNFDQDDFNRNRLSSGIEFKLAKNLHGELYYLWQSSESKGDWTDINVLGTKIKLIF